MKISRRHFLGSALAVPALAALRVNAQPAPASIGPNLLNTTDKAGNKAPVLGSGEFTYEALHDWGELPASIRWGNTHGVGEDAQHNIYVHHTVHAGSESSDSMVVFDEKGKFIRSWGSEFRGVAHGLAMRREGTEEFIYLTLNNATSAPAGVHPGISASVVKATLKGEIVWQIKGPPEIARYQTIGTNGKLPAYNPTNLAFAPNGDLYVADGYGSYFINQYDSNQQFIRSFGGRSPNGVGGTSTTGPDGPLGTLAEPHGIWMDRRGTEPVLMVADRRNNRLQRFTLDGKPIDAVTGFLQLPCHFDEHEGNVVMPDLKGRVTLMDRENRLITHLGEYNGPPGGNAQRNQPREKFIPGTFITPHGACFDHSGNIFVVEWVEVGRVTKLRRVS